MPNNFNWCNKDGINYCSVAKNQDNPQWCGSSWAFGAVSALADRVNIARGGKTPTNIQPSPQHMLNCGNVGSCYGGTIDGPYQWLHNISAKGRGISYETAQPYLACSSDSTEGFCTHVDTSCKPLNVARTCGTFAKEGGDEGEQTPCIGLSDYPNISISEYGSVSGAAEMKREIFHRGPIACGIDANPLLAYKSGIAGDAGELIDHVVAVTGWGTDPYDRFYWVVRNSYGQFWGESGFARVAAGALRLEDHCSWATVETFTAAEKHNQVHCHEGGDNCEASAPEEVVV